MKTPKENEKLIDDFDYLSNAASARECLSVPPSRDPKQKWIH